MRRRWPDSSFALLVDLDGVVRIWDVRELAVDAPCGLQPGAIRAAAFEPVPLQRALTGEITDEE